MNSNDTTHTYTSLSPQETGVLWCVAFASYGRVAKHTHTQSFVLSETVVSVY